MTNQDILLDIRQNTRKVRQIVRQDKHASIQYIRQLYQLNYDRAIDILFNLKKEYNHATRNR